MIKLSGDTTLATLSREFWPLSGRAESPPESGLGLYLAIAALQALLCAPWRTIEIDAQVSILSYRLDYLVGVDGRQIAFECDGMAFHANQAAFARDRRRDRELAAVGIETYRFTAAEINRDPGMVQSVAFNAIIRAFDSSKPKGAD